jgi:type IV pilus assembly protein PilM
VDWKKEIKVSDLVRRAPKDEAPAPAPVPEPFDPVAELVSADAEYGWLTAGFDPEVAEETLVPELAAPVSSVPAAVATAAQGKSSLLKKEISFSRKPKAPKAPKAAKEANEPKAEKPAGSGLRKEISFSRKPKAPKAAKEPKAEKPAGSGLRKEISFSRKPKVDKPAKQPREAKAPKGPKLQKGGKSAIVGLKIGASQVAAARVLNNGSPEVVQLARRPLDEGVVVGGELRDLEGLAETLRSFFAEHKLPRKNVRLGIANNRIGVRTFEITGIEDPKQLENAIRFRAQETLPIPLDEAVVDWQILAETVDADGVKTRRVLLVVAYRELVDRYVSACRKAGIKLVGIDLEAFAMLRALAVPRSEDEPVATGAQVVVNVGHDRSTFAVSDGKVCEFTRVLGWGGSALSVAIARALDVTPSEAEPLKLVLSLEDGAPLPEGVAVEHATAALEAVRRELQAFARELVSSLRFYQNQPGSHGIGELVLTGGTAHLPGLADELGRLTGVTVRIGDPLGRVAVGKRLVAPDQVGSLAVAIGLGIED